MITHTLRFFCLWYSTIVSFPFISYTTIHEISRILQRLLLYYQESSNRCSQDRIRTCNSLHQHIVKAETPCSSWDFYTMFRYVFLSPPDYLRLRSPPCCKPIVTFNSFLFYQYFLSQGNNTILLIVMEYPSRSNLNCFF